MSNDAQSPARRSTARRYSGQLVCDIVVNYDDADASGSPLYTVRISGQRGEDYGTWNVRLAPGLMARCSLQDYHGARSFDVVTRWAICNAMHDVEAVQELYGRDPALKYKRNRDLNDDESLLPIIRRRP